MRTNTRLLLTWLLLTLVLPPAAFAQQAPSAASIGTVTALQGQATVGRVTLPQPSPLKFRDNVFFRDQITTHAQATVRLLLGGKGVLTVREQSQVTLDETVAATGERRSVLSLLAGKVAAAIARTLMSPGEEVEIRTPNAVAAVRGTVLIAEYVPAAPRAANATPILLAANDPTFQVAQAAGQGGTSTFLTLTGSVTITTPGSPPVTVGPLQTVNVTGTAAGGQIGPVQNATPAQVAAATQGLAQDKSHTGEAAGSSTAQVQAQVAAAVADAIVQATTGLPVVTTPTTNPVSPDVAPVTPTIGSPENVLPAGPLLSLTDLTLAVPEGVTLMSFTSGDATSVAPLSLSGTGMESTIVTLPSSGSFDIQGNPITHSGPLVSMNAAGLDSVGPSLFQVNGATFTNSGGPLLAMAGGSQAYVSGSVLTVNGGSVNLSGPPAAVASVDNSYLGVAGNLITVGGGGSLNLTGPALTMTNGSEFYAGGVLFSFTGGSTFTVSGGPLVSVSDSDLVAGGIGSSDGSGVRGTISVPLLVATNAYVEFDMVPDNNNTNNDIVNMALPAGVAQYQFVNSSLYVSCSLCGPGSSHDLVDFGDGTTYNGLLLTAVASNLYMPGINLFSIYFDSGRSSVSSTEASVPLIQLTDTPLNNSGGPGPYYQDLMYIGGSGTLSLAGPLFSATGSSSQINSNGSLLHVDNGSTLSVSTSLPLLQLSNGASFCNAQSCNFGPLFYAPVINFMGNSTVNLSGPLASVTNSNITSDGSLLRMDNALLNAANATIFQITGGILKSNQNDTSGAISLYRSTITAQQFASLSNTDVRVQNGPLFNLTGGSVVNITGDFVTLANSAKITVFNGPLISADGAGTQFTVNGALANFVGSGNQVIITNLIVPDNMYPANGVPVNTSTGGTVSLAGTLVKNPGSGTVKVNGITVGGSGPFNGSLIKASNGASVVVKGQ